MSKDRISRILWGVHELNLCNGINVIMGRNDCTGILNKARRASIDNHAPAYIMDYPEANIHPADIEMLSKYLHILAGSGAQIILTTKSYLLVGELSLLTEYQVEPRIETLFINLHSDDGEIESGEVAADINEEEIVDAYSRHYTREQELFHGKGKK